jgi:prophage antirepressor-like protein
MTNLTSFAFDSAQIRVIYQDGEPWFVLSDILNALQTSATRAEWKGAVIEYFGDGGVISHPILDSLGREQNVLLISEAAMTFVISRSRTEVGKKFTRWIHSEVIPSIRKTGKYELKPMSQLEIIAASAQALLEIERKQKEMEARLSVIERDRAQAEEALSALPLAEESPQEIPTRGKINMIVRTKCQRDALTYHLAWSTLYQQLYYRYRYDVKARCRNSGLKPLDQIERDNMMDALHAIASEVLV